MPATGCKIFRLNLPARVRCRRGQPWQAHLAPNIRHLAGDFFKRLNWALLPLFRPRSRCWLFALRDRYSGGSECRLSEALLTWPSAVVDCESSDRAQAAFDSMDSRTSPIWAATTQLQTCGDA